MQTTLYDLDLVISGERSTEMDCFKHYSNPDAESLHNDVGKQVIYETLKLVFCLEDVQT